MCYSEVEQNLFKFCCFIISNGGIMSARIIIIDDDIKFIEEAKNILESKNYNVCSNFDINGDVDIDPVESLDLIILKIMMEGCERCIKLFAKNKKKFEQNNIPIIAITDTERDKYLSNEYYMDIDWKLVKNTLNKPIKNSDLLRCVDFTISNQKELAVRNFDFLN